MTTVAGAAALLCAASVFGAGPSFAAPAPSQAAAAPTLVGGCGDTVRGTPGQRVGLRVAGLSVINLGQVPSSGATTFDATSVVRGLLGPLTPMCRLSAEALPLPAVLAPVGAAAAPVLGAVQGAVGPLPVLPQQPAPAPAAPAPAPAGQVPAVTPQAPAAAPVFGPTLPQFTPFSLGRFHSNLPLYNYAELLVGRPGAIGRLQTGMLNSNLFGATPGGVTSLGAQDPAANDVAAAGRASALPASGADRVALPVLVAVLMLAAVSAALIRSWVVVTRR
ncbi:MAG TPA: hypothetical protein VFQ77_04680 [Pseudonocardiaceae bacterium]|nr:hypothetical protein [Pseudonocardiaceae bacterium]